MKINFLPLIHFYCFMKKQHLNILDYILYSGFKMLNNCFWSVVKFLSKNSKYMNVYFYRFGTFYLQIRVIFQIGFLFL